jgi:hypothetical protein
MGEKDAGLTFGAFVVDDSAFVVAFGFHFYVAFGA